MIANWLAARHSAPVAMLERDLRATRRLSGLRYFFALAGRVFVLDAMVFATLSRLGGETTLTRDFDRLVPHWLVLLAREGVELVWAKHWAEIHLAPRGIDHLYVTMNHTLENGVRLGLAHVPCAYVEHGFPRRDIAPLPIKQYVYSDGYAGYLRSFEPALEIEIIGLAYFPKAKIAPSRTILIASLQDWAAFKIADVADIFNRALGEARSRGWRIVFRTRRYGSDAFAEALRGPWDEISEAQDETFAECLARVRPAQIWTTWSTAILDARAAGLDAVAFVTPSLEDHFIADLEPFALRVMPDGTGAADLSARLARAA